MPLFTEVPRRGFLRSSQARSSKKFGGKKEGRRRTPPALLSQTFLGCLSPAKRRRLLFSARHLLAAPASLRAGVHDAPVVWSLAPRGRVVGVAVADVDLVPALGALDHVDVVGVRIGLDEVVPPAGQYLVGLAVAFALEDLVVV